MVVIALICARESPAQTPPLVCYGNEPSWSLELSEATARFQTSGEGESDFTGGASIIAALKVQAWRGRPADGRGGDLVAFLTEAQCSDAMSDLKRPFIARVSLPDGRLFAGCCRLDTMRRAAPSASVPAAIDLGARSRCGGPAGGRRRRRPRPPRLGRLAPGVPACPSGLHVRGDAHGGGGLRRGQAQERRAPGAAAVGPAATPIATPSPTAPRASRSGRRWRSCPRTSRLRC